jgi:hypothetical protein
MRSGTRWDNRGLMLIGSYLVLSLFLIYSSAMTIRTTSQQMVAGRVHDRLQALDLARGAIEQFREDFYQLFKSQVGGTGDVLVAYTWLDHWADAGAFNLNDISNSPSTAQGSGIEADPRIITLPAGSGTAQAAAWMASVAPLNEDTVVVNGSFDPGEQDVNGNGRVDVPGPFAPRVITVEAEATVGAVVDKRVRATFLVEMGVSDIFRNAYFVNNYGWLDSGSSEIYIAGDVRANGDLDITGDMDAITVDGELYASVNSETGATGAITGNPNQTDDWLNYWDEKDGVDQRRPSLRLTEANQSAIGGTPQFMPDGQGWDSANPDQAQYAGQAQQDLPYLGNLTLYQTLATSHNNGAGSTLQYYQANPDGTLSNTQLTINAIAGSTAPIVLIGTSAKPIVIDGPVVIPGDVIIRGVIQGRGTVYAGRNVHVVGSLTYKAPPKWQLMERDLGTGQIRQEGKTGTDEGANLGTVCSNGTYVAPGGTIPGGCI